MSTPTNSILAKPAALAPAQQSDLLKAIARHCECQHDLDGALERVCPSHRALVEDPRWAFRLVFIRSLRVQLTVEERIGSEWA